MFMIKSSWRRHILLLNFFQIFCNLIQELNSEFFRMKEPSFDPLVYSKARNNKMRRQKNNTTLLKHFQNKIEKLQTETTSVPLHDWLIEWCLTSSKHFFSSIQDEIPLHTTNIYMIAHCLIAELSDRRIDKHIKSKICLPPEKYIMIIHILLVTNLNSPRQNRKNINISKLFFFSQKKIQSYMPKRFNNETTFSFTYFIYSIYNMLDML